jgi:hypothetical protein
MIAMETYTSASGVRYEIYPRVYNRANGGILEGRELSDMEVTTYEVFSGDRFVTFANAEDGVIEAIDRFENPGPDLGSKYD